MLVQCTCTSLGLCDVHIFLSTCTNVLLPSEPQVPREPGESEEPTWGSVVAGVGPSLVYMQDSTLAKTASDLYCS